MKTFQFQRSDIDYFYDYHTIVKMDHYRISTLGGGWLIDCSEKSENCMELLYLTSSELENIYNLSFNILKDDSIYIYIDDNGTKWMQTNVNPNGTII